jgi:hypothetical protein
MQLPFLTTGHNISTSQYCDWYDCNLHNLAGLIPQSEHDSLHMSMARCFEAQCNEKASEHNIIRTRRNFRL